MNYPTEHDRTTIVEMLRRYRDAQETLLHSGAGSDGNPKLMPRTWTPEMRELERCLCELARRRPLEHRHVMARYVDPVLSRRTLAGRARGDGLVWPGLGPHAEVRTASKLPEHSKTSLYTCLVASWPSWVLKTLTEAGIDRLVGWYVAPSAVGPAVFVDVETERRLASLEAA